MFVIQLAAASGLDVITTASPQNFDLLKSFGAQHVLDYTSPTVIEDISKLTHGRLEYIFDCHSTDNSTQTAVKCLPGAGGKIATLLFVDESTLDRKVEVYVPLLYKISGKGFPFAGRTMAASEEDKRWGEEWCEKLKIKASEEERMVDLRLWRRGSSLCRKGRCMLRSWCMRFVRSEILDFALR